MFELIFILKNYLVNRIPLNHIIKPRNHAIPIINPITNRSIFENSTIRYSIDDLKKMKTKSIINNPLKNRDDCNSIIMNKSVDYEKMEKPNGNEYLRKLVNILNKITPSNFDILLNEINCCGLNEDHILEKVISLIIEKAIIETKFSHLYAKMCNCLKFSENIQKKFDFKLIKKCQYEFEKHRITKTSEEIKIFRKRSTGMIVFIGKLYLVGILTSNIMNMCFHNLIYTYILSELTVECALILLKSIGNITELNSNIKLSEYMKKIEEIKNSNEIILTSRIKFMIMDMEDLIKNKWNARIPMEIPKKIDKTEVN